ncbi:MAG: DNA-binding domain-containing protein [Arenimonas sp.]
MNTSLQIMQRDFLASLCKQDGEQITDALMEKPLSKLGLRAYIHAYSSRLTEALDNDHPCLGAYLGDALWHRMCNGYIEKNPSTYRSLRNFGDALPDYLRHTDDFKKNPEIAELANLERQLLNCFDAPDAECIEFTELLSISEQAWPTLQLKFHPSLLILRHSYNSIAIWQAIKDEATLPSLIKENSDWLLWRDADRITSFRSSDIFEQSHLRFFMEGGNFSGFCENLLLGHDAEQVPMIALGFIKAWCAEGLVMAIS